jgi:hypothetical protein
MGLSNALFVGWLTLKLKVAPLATKTRNDVDRAKIFEEYSNDGSTDN